MNRYVDVIESLLVAQVLLKVLHVLEEQIFVTFKILCLLLGFVTNVNQNLIAR